MELLLNTIKWGLVTGAAALLLTVIKPLLDKWYSPRWRYGVWLVMALLLLLAPIQPLLLPRQEVIEPPVQISVPRLELAVSREEGVSLQRPAEDNAAARTGVLPVQDADAPASRRTFDMNRILPAMWALGAAAFALYHLLGTWAFQHRMLRWSRLPDEATVQLYTSVQRDMGLKKIPCLRVSKWAASPMLIGLVRPRLVVPDQDYSQQELGFILRHELTHYRRHDLWYKLVVLAANAVHWFNPLVYLMAREAAKDMELTCDAAVVAGADALARRAYSETLLAAVHRQKGLGRSALSTHFYGGAEVMKERFRNILGSQGRKWGLAALVLTLLLTVATACAVGLSQPSGPKELTKEELEAWQEKINTPDQLGQYLRRMYTDRTYLPPQELIESLESSEQIHATVLSGTQNGDTVTLELEGSFSSGLSRGTLTLADGEPVSFTNPLYTAVEEMAWNTIIASTTAGQGVEIAERCITSLYCAESLQLEDTFWYVWEVYDWFKPADMSQITLAGGMEEQNGWISNSYYAPVLIISEDGSGNMSLEEVSAAWQLENGFTWEDYVYCHTILGMDMGAVLNGWPEINMEFIQSQLDGHQAGFNDWQDVARSYLSQLGAEPTEELTIVRSAKTEGQDYDESLVVRTACGEYAARILMTHIVYPVGDQTVSFWQVNSVWWDPEVPDFTPAEEPVDIPEKEEPPSGESEELSADALAAIADYFNTGNTGGQDSYARARNGLLRFPYESFDGIRHYLEILFYDAGETVTDEEELAALEERMGTPIETDCFRLTRKFIREFLSWEFVEEVSDDALRTMLEEHLSLPNLEEYEAFYLIHGDTMMTSYQFDRGIREADGTIKVYYTTDLWVWEESGEMNILWDQPMCAAMQLVGQDTWGMISNTIAE